MSFSKISFKRPFFQLSSQERLQSKREILQSREKGQAIRIFGYGSLMWNPGIVYQNSEPGVLMGYQRDFCVWSQLARGTGNRPGLGLGLKQGGQCYGILFRVAEADAEAELQKIWEREMYTKIYRPCWLPVQIQHEIVPAIAFVVNTSDEQYAENLSLKEKAYYITSAYGENGSCLDYFLNSIEQLKKFNIIDPNLEKIRETIFG